MIKIDCCIYLEYVNDPEKGFFHTVKIWKALVNESKGEWEKRSYKLLLYATK